MMPIELFFQNENLIIDEVGVMGEPIQMGLPIVLYTTLTFLIQIIYYAFAFKQIFQIKTHHAILKSLLLVLGLFIFIVIGTISVVIANAIIFNS